MLRASTTRDDHARAVERLLEGGSAVGLTEAQLVERFASRRDEAAFAALVDRHGPMVLGVCRRLLRDPNDADDAFQAVFLVLARKAGGLRRRELVANWLHGVARRVASEARRRPRPATPGDESAFDADARRPAPPDPSDAASRDEDGRRLHEEVGRLPERYRAPVVVCYFEGRTHEEAAALLDWPVGTVKGRLARARDLLRARLERRGVTAPAAALATALAGPDLRAAVPPALASRAVAAAMAAVASPSAWMTSAVLSTSARSLSEGAIQAMFYAQLKSIAIPATLAAGLLAAGAGLAAAGRDAPQTAGTPSPAPPAASAEADATVPAKADLASGRLDVLKRIDAAAGMVVRAFDEREADSLGMADGPERSEILERFRGDVDEIVAQLRPVAPPDPGSRQLLEAFIESLHRTRGDDAAGAGPVDDARALTRAYFLFDRSIQRAALSVTEKLGPEALEAARKRHAEIISPLLISLRESQEEGESKRLLARYADFLEATDPFAAGLDATTAPAASDDAPRQEFVRADLSLSPGEVLELIDRTSKGVVERVKESKIDAVGASIQETSDLIDRLCDEVDELVGQLRSSQVAEPKGRALLDGFADSLARVMQLRGTQGGEVTGPLRDAESLDEAYIVFKRSVDRARREVASRPEAREAALKRHQAVLVQLLPTLRAAHESNVTQPLLAAYADYLEAFDPFAEAPAFRPASADAPASTGAAAEDPPAGRGVSDALNVAWEAAANSQKSYQAAIQFVEPIEPREKAEAMSRHRDRMGRLGQSVRGRAADDPLLLSLADYLESRSKSAGRAADQAPMPDMALSLIAAVRPMLSQMLDHAKHELGPDPSEFDREMAREKLAWIRDHVLAESLRQAERDQGDRELLTRHAEAVRKLLDDVSILTAPPSEPAATSPAPVAAAPAGPPAAAPAATIADKDALKIAWRTASRYKESLDAALRPAMGKPQDDPKAAAAMARHLERVGRMAEDVQRRSAGDRLLLNLAAYLAADSQSPPRKPSEPAAEAAPATIETFSLMLMARDNLTRVRDQERMAMERANPDEFDRALIRERVEQFMESDFDHLARQAETNPRARDLLSSYAEALKRYIESGEYLSPSPPAPNPEISPEPAGAAASPAAAPAPAGGGGGFGGGGFEGPSPGEVRQKVAGLAATLAGIDDDPSNRKVHDALDRPAALKAEGNPTLGGLIEQVKAALKAEDGSPIPVYVDPKGLEDADVTLESPVAIDLEGVPLRFSLRLALKQLGLASCVRDGVLIVSSLEGIEQELLEAQREMMSTRPGSFILQPDGTTLPAANMGRPGGMM